ncbi:MAG TPA: nitrite reductase [Thermoanaerobaculia bacterium]|jgi:sulfite reductase (ferredoxin)|nr:nitrite reductase [Thermoanaerobaculia bacterium]
MSATTETKAQKAERLKREKNPWEALAELRTFAAKGFDAIPPEWLGTYLRWWGVYTQGDGAGVLGGRNGEGKSAPYLMVRIRVTNGLLLAHQVRTIAAVAEKYARGGADITVRQNIQLHWIAIEDLPEILESLWRVGLTTTGSCGDDTRNITGCPLAGIDASELIDASPLAAQATRMLVGDPRFYNLPRKFKVTITGCRDWCSYPEINDVGLTATQRGDEIGFSMRVGGGLSADPHLAVRLNAFIRWNQVLPVLRAAAEIFRDADALREHRDRARLKHLFLRHGWTGDQFLGELQRRVPFQIDEGTAEVPPADVFRDHAGIHPQKQEGYSYVGASVLRGRITAKQLVVAANIAEAFGSGELRTTISQNLLIANVPTRNAEAVARELSDAGLPTGGSPFARGTVACTGSQFCKLGITETKSFARWLVDELDTRLPGFEEQLKINISGCPNSCGQHWIADLGIEGKKINDGGKLVDAYYFCVGGGVGLHASIARPIGYRCAASEVPDAIERLLRTWDEERTGGEPLRAFLGRRSEDELRSIMAGTAVEVALRDPSPGRPPHSLEM